MCLRCRTLYVMNGESKREQKLDLKDFAVDRGGMCGWKEIGPAADLGLFIINLQTHEVELRMY